MNITIHSIGKIITPNGKNIDYEKLFNCVQTPTKVTWAILESSSPITTYKNWLVDNNHKYNLNDLEKFIKESEDGGFKIEVSYI